jgi:hypothetical protein
MGAKWCKRNIKWSLTASGDVGSISSTLMCIKCTKRSLGREIISVEMKLDSLFKKIEESPFDLKKDLELASLANKMATFLDKYEKLCATSV